MNVVLSAVEMKRLEYTGMQKKNVGYWRNEEMECEVERKAFSNNQYFIILKIRSVNERPFITKI